MACQTRILKSKNVEVFLLFTNISDIREKNLHSPDIKVFYGKRAQHIHEIKKGSSLPFNPSGSGLHGLLPKPTFKWG